MVYGSKEEKDPSERERENRLGPSFVLTCSSFNVHYDTKQWTPVRNLRGAVFLCFFLLSKSEPFLCYLVKLQRLNENWCVQHVMAAADKLVGQYFQTNFTFDLNHHLLSPGSSCFVRSRTFLTFHKQQQWSCFALSSQQSL